MVEVKPPRVLGADEYYFTRVVWIDETDVAVTWINRAFNLSVISRCSPPTYRCQEVRRGMENMIALIGLSD